MGDDATREGPEPSLRFGYGAPHVRSRVTAINASIAPRTISPHSGSVGIGTGLTVAKAAVDALLAGFGSTSADATLAVFDTGPAVLDVLTTKVTVALAPLAREPMAQVTVVVPLQLPWDGVAETKVVPAGITSVTTTAVAAPGPALAEP
jgi:hypothetical protein